MHDYYIASKFRNKDNVNELISKLREKGYSCYNWADVPANPNNPEASAEEQMKVFENERDFFNDEYTQEVFKNDLEGLKGANNVILLLPAGKSSHMEIGIAYGLGKKCILIGEAEKPDTLYLMFEERYKDINEFLNSI